jgi:hypothetical protein
MAIRFLDEPEGTRSRVRFLDEETTETKPGKVRFIEEDEPGLGKIGTGLAAEVAIGEGAKLAGASAGALLGPVGAGIGYVVGGIAGGVAGSLAAQEIEGREDLSWGRVAADTFLNLIPGGLGKAKKGVGVLPRLAQEGAKRAAGGAVISAAGAQLEKAVDDRGLPKVQRQGFSDIE